MKTGYSRVYNVDAHALVSDAILWKIERILAQDTTLDKTWFEGIMGQGANYFKALERPLQIPFDFYNREIRSVGTITGLMLLVLRSIPIISTAYCPTEEQKGDLLGCYTRHGSRPGIPDEAHIELYSDQIRKAAAHDDTKFENLCLTTIIHELAHAVMDPANYLYTRSGHHSETFRSWSVTIGNEHTDFYTLREESFAELMMYRVMAQSPKSVLNALPLPELQGQIKGKSVPYHLALYLLYNYYNPDFAGWMRAKDSVEPIFEKQADVQQWLDGADRFFAAQLTNMRLSVMDEGMPWI